MGQKVTIGGDRVGSGKKMKAELHNYFRSTHNLSEDWASSMGAGILYPCLCKLALRGDSFDIVADMDARTIPTKGPLFGSYKMQLDIYECPIRLYQGILHNNPLAIGLKMNQVKFPMLEIETNVDVGEWDAGKFNDSCLLKYLGMSGLGQAEDLTSSSTITRQILAIPALAYYDIFKQYYANKQEKNAYVIGGEGIYDIYGLTEDDKYTIQSNTSTLNIEKNCGTMSSISNIPEGAILRCNTNVKNLHEILTDNGDNEAAAYVKTRNIFKVSYLNESEVEVPYIFSLQTLIQINWEFEDEFINVKCTALDEKTGFIQISVAAKQKIDDLYNIGYYAINAEKKTGKNLKIVSFELTNIDNMRYDILSNNRLGTQFTITESGSYLPYSILVEKDDNSVTYNKMPLNGLVLKTYQNDIFNNWLNTEWIEGENGINELTKVSVVNGAFSMDALNFAQKLYNMLNRVAVAGATYEDWQDVVYEEIARRQIESPIYLGGLSKEITFDEIVQTAPQGEGENRTELGTLGGRGSAKDRTRKGGKIHVKCEEAAFIIGIISLTPRQYNTQGNEFYMTEIQSMDDLHKPGMDGIGFQDLIGERMAYWDTRLDGSEITHRSKIGKLPAWIEYMTSYNRAFGDFAAEGGKGFMILNRNYEYDTETGGIKDATTYIDPSKYNYAFAYSELDAQNFWVKVSFDIKARRLMSARLIPNV